LFSSFEFPAILPISQYHRWRMNMSNKPNDDVREITPEGVTKSGPGTINRPAPQIPGFRGPGA
jgi:hypothetical protein